MDLSGCLERKFEKSFASRELLPELIYLDEDEANEDIHHRRVELETEVGATGVEYPTHVASAIQLFATFVVSAKSYPRCINFYYVGFELYIL